MHPIGGRQVGWDEVRASWENVAKIFSNGQVNLSDQRICVGGDLAYELGIEHVHVWLAGNEVRADFRATNIYRREGSEWRMIHHHVDLDRTIVEIVSKLGSSQNLF
jgi:ketosteroid isomerase-like protein